MKICDGPKVYVVGNQEIGVSDLVQFKADEGISSSDNIAGSDAEFLVETAGRLCYMSFANPRPGGNKAYIKHLIEVGHGSVLEHAIFNLIFTGVSRSLTHELIRHRAGMSYSQLSQRYVDESDVAFVVPPALEEEVASCKDESRFVLGKYRGSGAKWILGREADLEEYAAHVEYLTEKFGGGTENRKKAREAARSVLPNCTETKIFVTANARALRHFVELRGDLGADAEIRRLALAVLTTMRMRVPAIFGDYENRFDNGTEYVFTEHKKV